MEFRDLKRQYQVLKPQMDAAMLEVAQNCNFIGGAQVTQLEKQLEGRHTAAPAPSESELEAYRRAERVERTAKERARQLGQQTAQVLDQASGQVEDAAGQIAQVSTQLGQLLDQLQSVMDSSRRTVREAVGAVQSLGDNVQ